MKLSYLSLFIGKNINNEPKSVERPANDEIMSEYIIFILNYILLDIKKDYQIASMKTN